MGGLGTLIVVLLVFVGAVTAISRDARLDRREILIQSGIIAAYLAGCALLAFALLPLGRRIGAVAAAAIGIAAIGLGMVALARYLSKRLARGRRL